MGEPATLAFAFRDNFYALRLPNILRSDSLSVAALLLELSDAMFYKSSESAKSAVPEKRIFLIGRRLALVQS